MNKIVQLNVFVWGGNNPLGGKKRKRPRLDFISSREIKGILLKVKEKLQKLENWHFCTSN